MTLSDIKERTPTLFYAVVIRFNELANQALITIMIVGFLQVSNNIFKVTLYSFFGARGIGTNGASV